MGRLAQKVKRFRQRNPRTLRVVRNWTLPVLVVCTLLAIVHTTVAADSSPTADQVQAYLAKNPLIIFSQPEDGYQQVFFKYKTDYIKLTSGDHNHAWAVSDDHYVAWQQEEPAGAQLYLHDLYTGSTMQITSSGVNAEPSINASTMVWRKYVNDTWQIFFYNGLSTLQLTEGPHSYYHPSTDGTQIIYAEQVATDQWRAHSYNIQTHQDTVIKEGDKISTAFPRFDDEGKVTTAYRPDPVQD